MAISKHNMPTCPIINIIHGRKRSAIARCILMFCLYTLRCFIFRVDTYANWRYQVAIKTCLFSPFFSWMFIKTFYCCHSLMKLNYNTTQCFPFHKRYLLAGDYAMEFISFSWNRMRRSPTQQSNLIDISDFIPKPTTKNLSPSGVACVLV